MDKTKKLWNLILCNFWVLLSDIYFWDWALASVSTQFEIFLVISYFLRSWIWSRLGDRSFDKRFYRIPQSCCHCLKICYLFGSQLIWWRHGMHPVFQTERRKNLVKNLLCWVKKKLLSERDCIMGQITFLKGVQGISEKIENYITAV